MEFLLWKVLVPLVLLSLVVFFHELGHFLVGKLFGVKIEAFSIGFGPKLLGYTWGETEYRLSLYPLGGYVKFANENGDEGVQPDDPDQGRHFVSKHPFKRILIAFAGPLANFIKAAVCYSWLFLSVGVVIKTLNVIDEVGKNSPAEKAGLRRGDRIVSVNGQKISDFEQVRILVATSEGKSLNLEVLRGKKVVHLTVIPESITKAETKYYIIGVKPASKSKEIRNLPDAVQEGVKSTGDDIKSQVWGIKQIVSGGISPKNLSGPLGILNEAGKATDVAKQIGWEVILGFLIFLNIGLGIANLLPILPLDGGIIFFSVIEWIRGKPVSKETQMRVTNTGILLLLFLFIYASFNDFGRLGK